ncbi:MAG: hypothetical protein WD826_05705, partial [Actinomycetota bacterium]
TSNTFLLHFAPYFLSAIATVAVAGGGTYTFQAFALVSATFWIHIAASISALLRIGGGFRVTPKTRRLGRQITTVLPALAVVLALLAAAVHGLVRDRSPATLNNVGFACLHIVVLLTGAWPALVRSR